VDPQDELVEVAPEAVRRQEYQPDDGGGDDDRDRRKEFRLPS
jgi:hypothetical protein